MLKVDQQPKRYRWHTEVLPWANEFQEIKLPKRDLLGHTIERKMLAHSLGPNRLAEVSVHQTIKKNRVSFLPILGGQTVNYGVKTHEIRTLKRQTIHGVDFKFYRHNGRLLIVDGTKNPTEHNIVTFLPDLLRISMTEPPHLISVGSPHPQA